MSMRARSIVSSKRNKTRLPMPTKDLPGWQFIHGEDFLGTSLPANWGTYEGQPGGPDNLSTAKSRWHPSHVTVQDSILTLATYKDVAVNSDPTVWVSGGTALAGQSQTYGKYLVHWRADPGDGIAAIGLLWPDSDDWPPEIDFFEDGGGDRSHTTATLHFNVADNMIQNSTQGDFTQWHTLGIEWTAGKCVYTMDGAIWGMVEHSTAVPSMPMHLAFQTQMWEPTVNTPTRADMQIDWVAIYAYSPGTPGA